MIYLGDNSGKDIFSINQGEYIKASPSAPVAVTTPSTDGMEQKEPRASERELTSSLYATKEAELQSAQPE